MIAAHRTKLNTYTNAQQHGDSHTLTNTHTWAFSMQLISHLERMLLYIYVFDGDSSIRTVNGHLTLFYLLCDAWLHKNCDLFRVFVYPIPCWCFFLLLNNVNSLNR